MTTNPTDPTEPSPTEPTDATDAGDASPATPDEADSFAALGLCEELLSSLSALGYEEPTPIQREAIPPLLEGRDLLGQAATGTGKTAAFALPLLQRFVASSKSNAVSALILVPTRELAMQVGEAVHRYGRALGVRVLPIYGGQPIGRQLHALERGVHVVVATPGRALDHIRRGTLALANLKVLVLDEADEMLDMGFAEDLEAILDATPPERQTVLFSATMPPRINGIARRSLRDPVRIEIAREETAAGEGPLVRQTAYVVPRAHKLAALGRVLDGEAPTAALLFCRTRNEVDVLTESLNARGYRAEALHGGMSQEQRDRVMSRLRSGTSDLLVATDVAARGLDIEQLTHVVNYDVPSAPEAYVHRIGRVGRAGRTGVALTFVEPREHRLLKNIQRLTKQTIQFAKVPTVADLRARRLELTRASLREAILGDDLDDVRVIVESLAGEFDVMEVALAAVKLAHEATRGDDEDQVDIPDIALRQEREARPRAPRDTRPGEGMTRLYVGLGRLQGVRPHDLVGAIANEAGLSGREIGAIEIADRFALVEVPEGRADDVINAMKTSTIKGKKATIRREKFDQAARPAPADRPDVRPKPPRADKPVPRADRAEPFPKPPRADKPGPRADRAEPGPKGPRADKPGPRADRVEPGPNGPRADKPRPRPKPAGGDRPVQRPKPAGGNRPVQRPKPPRADKDDRRR